MRSMREICTLLNAPVHVSFSKMCLKSGYRADKIREY